MKNEYNSRDCTILRRDS